MQSEKTYYCYVNAKDSVKLDFPYGTVMARLFVRKSRGRTDIVVQVDNGQFNAQVDGTPIRVKFDEEKIQTYYCGEPSDTVVPTLFFVKDVKGFLSRLKKAKTSSLKLTFILTGLNKRSWSLIRKVFCGNIDYNGGKYKPEAIY